MSDDLKQKMAQIALAVASGQYRYTIHGSQQRIARDIWGHAVEEAIASGEIIGHYAEHRYGPACLILGRTIRGKVLYVLCSMRPVVNIITVYQPDANEW